MAASDQPLIANTSSDKQRLLSALMSALRNRELDSDQLLPAVIVSFDRVKNIAVVQALIKWVDVNDGLHSRNPLAGINVLSIGGGGFHISFPLNPGDIGWIFAPDRDISLFKQSLKESTPNTGRLHKFEDGWFVPDVFRNYTINGADTSAMVIQSTDATTRISIQEGIITITAPTSVKIDTPTATFTNNVVIQGNLNVTSQTTTGTLNVL
jgi:hypothetical protein